MSNRHTDPKKSIAFWKAGTAMAVAASVTLSPWFVRDAYALKIFGITLFGSDDKEQEVLDPVKFTVTLNSTGADDKLRKSLENSSLLTSEPNKPASGDLGLLIRARDDRERIVAALYENARYGGTVKITVAGQDIDAIPPNPSFNRSAPVPVVIDVTPGPVFTLGAIKLEGDVAGRDLTEYGLVTGGDAGSLAIIRGGNKLIEALKAEGRPLAKLTKREAVANHATNTVDLTLSAEGGPIAPLGEVAVKGEKTVDGDFIRRYSRLNGGEPYSPEKLRKASDRLRKLGVFSSITIKEANALSRNGSIPLTIEVSEGKHRYLGLGAQYSTTEGIGLQGYWGHRNLFGKAESLRIEGAVSRLGEASNVKDMDYSAGIIFTKPGIFNPETTFTASLKAKTEHPDSYDARSITGYGGFSYEFNDYDTASAGLEVEWTDADDAFGNNQYLTTSIPLEFVRDRRDDKLNPTEGFRAAISAQPSFEALNGTFFTSFEGSTTAYKGLGSDDQVVLAGKIAGGLLVGASSLEDVPATRRFYAGGGGSVRGYSYQEISPYNADGEATGGRSYVVSSVEARIKVTDTIGLVPFVDAGVVSSDLAPDFSDIRAGAGIGLRYATPFGPLRLDVAMPLKKYENGSSFGIYAGIGQAF
ncbi:autotransporter assembly complex protein TamA [Agrobacterium rubi]|uniref:Outer membrane protein assembly factor n=1 Tax=Agrobacterium rubi TaxID=28099 RepID=A0AAE7R9Z3_9HYPH|nr:autotransporter assembly complex family protein [Agrobacterium rubi]NTE87353.1 outer membrane protein assembly factor [Agrobacterium rubi]NTF03616.1 outer membrane protein assembly factor [Agrobacterium rubi]NTF37775.1 outer membrane protein assembly factor [Agrobacterium rubi]QTG00064.1 outer membrane protein assembly factor [Agrobacterium rubi]